MYAMSADPVQRARRQRLDRLRRRNMVCGPQYGMQHSHRQRPQRMPRHRHADGYYGDGFDPYGEMYGYDDYGYDEYAFDPYFDGYSMMGYEEEMMPGEELALMGHTGWMPSGGCNCGEMHDGMIIDGGWTATSDCPECQKAMESSSPTPMPETVTPQVFESTTGLQPMPRTTSHSVSVPVNAEDFYTPRPMPAPMPAGTSIESTSGGSPVQPVLWVPNGL
jgi:hypothetical protein